MRRTRWGLITIVTVGLVMAFSGAVASGAVLAPPGHAGANQYFETIPTSRGNAAPPGSVHGSGSAHSGAQSLRSFGQGATTDAKLAALGKTGQAAAALAAATAPAPAPGAARQATGGAASADGASAGGGSAGTGILHALSGSDAGGLGLALPLLLVTALLIALGLLGTRLMRRAGGAPPSS